MINSNFTHSWESEDEFKTKQSRQETADEKGTVTGEYSFEADGLKRTVKYIADENGFRAQVETNEPGTLTSNPADVEIKSNANN